MAMNLPVDSKVTQCIDSFIREVDSDFHAPHQSNFQDFMPKVKRDVQAMEESLSKDKSYVRKLTTSLKEVIRTGEIHGNAITAFADELVKFGTAASATEPEIGNAFVKFGTIFNQMSSLLGNLISSTKSVIFFSLNLLFENELKGGKYKSNINNMYSQYEGARNQTERDEKKQLQQLGFNPQERVFTAEELSGKLIEDRRKFQLGVCEYLVKVLDVRNKRGVDFADHLVGYYQNAQANYFKDGSKLLLALEQWETKLTTQLAEIRSKQDKEKKRLVSLKEKIQKDLGVGVIKAGIIQVDPSHNTGLTEKSGYLAKRPEMLKLFLTRRQWPKHYCTVSRNGFTMAHSHTHAPTVRIPVMLFQFKESGEVDGRKHCFKLQAQTRAYMFDAESEIELDQWRQVMTNCQLELFGGDTMPTKGGGPDKVASPTLVGDARQLVKKIISKIQCLPGNDRCCDCNGPDPEWLSVNLGVLMCIHCSGRHRELGVQYSRIRSLKLDALKSSELLIARVMGNALLNEVLEANVNETSKLSPNADMDQRREFITDKYINRKFIEHQIDTSLLIQALLDSVDFRDIRHLLQVYAEGADLRAPLHDNGFTALHIAIEQEDLTSLHLVDFILGNSRSENQPDNDGNTPLHIAALTDNPQCIKLLLNHNASVTIKNKEGKTPRDIAEEKKFDDCLELLVDASKGKFSKCEHIDIDWGVNMSDYPEDDNIYQTPVDLTNSNGTRIKRSETADNLLDGGRSTSTLMLNSGQLSAASPLLGNRGGIKRPVSQLVTGPPADGKLAPTSFPPPSEPAPPPPPRTVSSNAVPLNNYPSSGPVAPKRTKRISMMPSVHYEQPRIPASPTVRSPISPTLQVEAQYKCTPDREDELGFEEGEIIIVTKKINKDWWKGYIKNDKSRSGLFPSNYVQECTNDFS